MSANEKSVLVFDIGKTHVKVTVLSDTGVELYQNRISNKIKQTDLYNNYDVEAIWAWLLNELTNLTPRFNINAISIATHGAAAALINSDTGELLLPIMDYEFEDYPDTLPDYSSLRPSFEETGSPEFPNGLNLGRQLHWQSHLLPDDIKKNATLLMYPQYWAWRLTGKPSAEITSLGCHTDLWNIKTNAPSSLLEKIGLEHAIPPLSNAWTAIGTVKNAIANSVGLNNRCDVYPGVHDSNAGYLAILSLPKTKRPTVVSTGTWSVIMDAQADCGALDPSRDMLVNIDAEGSSLATARYMGGREFGLICERLNTDIATTFTDDDIKAIVSSNTYIMPSFCSGTGPYPNAKGQVIFENDVHPINGKAAATIYSALMVNNILKRLNPSSEQDILVEGSFAQNSVLCRLLAALNPNRAVRTQNGGNGVTEGCFLLTQWDSPKQNTLNPKVPPYPLNTFAAYAKRWEERLLG